MSATTYLPDEGLDTTGTTVGLVEGDLTDDLVAIVPVIASVMLFIKLYWGSWDGVRRAGEHTCGAS